MEEVGVGSSLHAKVQPLGELQNIPTPSRLQVAISSSNRPGGGGGG